MYIIAMLQARRLQKQKWYKQRKEAETRTYKIDNNVQFQAI